MHCYFLITNLFTTLCIPIGNISFIFLPFLATNSYGIKIKVILLDLKH